VSIKTNGSADVKLLQRIVARDGAAIRDLFDLYGKLLFGVIMRILRSRPDAEEVLQEVFVRVWTSADLYDENLGAPVPWLVHLARNRAIDRLRARRSRGEGAPLPPGVRGVGTAAGLMPEVVGLDVETRQTVHGALAVLPSEQRALIEAAFFEGYTHSELANRFGLPLGTVKTRIRAGMIALRQHLEHTV